MGLAWLCTLLLSLSPNSPDGLRILHAGGGTEGLQAGWEKHCTKSLISRVVLSVAPGPHCCRGLCLVGSPELLFAVVHRPFTMAASPCPVQATGSGRWASAGAVHGLSGRGTRA